MVVSAYDNETKTKVGKMIFCHICIKFLLGRDKENKSFRAPDVLPKNTEGDKNLNQVRVKKSSLLKNSLTSRFNHENVIDIRDILRSTSLDSMKDVYIVQVNNRERLWSHFHLNLIRENGRHLMNFHIFT